MIMMTKKRKRRKKRRKKMKQMKKPLGTDFKYRGIKRTTYTVYNPRRKILKW